MKASEFLVIHKHGERILQINAVYEHNPIYLKELIRTRNAYSGDTRAEVKKHDRPRRFSGLITEILAAARQDISRMREMNIE